MLSNRHGWQVLAGSCLAGVLLLAVLYLAVGVQFRFDGYGEGLYDLHYIAGGWLQQGWPTPELWNPDAQVVHYYNFGLAGWGWLGRWLGLELGQVYVLGLLLFPALVFAVYCAMMGGSWWLRASAALVATFPATGISLLVGGGIVDLPEHLRNMGHVRLTEWADRIGQSQWAEILITGRAYPVESLAHVNLDLQDLHPPVFSFLLLATLLLWFFGPAVRKVTAPSLQGDSGVLDSVWPEPAPPPAVANPPLWRQLLRGVWPGFLLPLCFALNAWVVPVFVGAVGGLMLLRAESKQWLGAALGALLGFALLWWPFFRHFESPAAVGVVLLDAEHRSELLSWAMIWGPCLIATVWLYLGLAFGRRKVWGEWAYFAPLLFLLAVLSLEVVHLDDPYSGTHERFNSVLKTGSVALSAWVVSLLVLATRTRRLSIALPILIALAVPSALQLKDIGQKLWSGASAAPNWALEPAQMIREDDLRSVFEELQHQPEGIVLEFTQATAYTVTPMVSTLAAMPTWSGWASHLAQVQSFDQSAWNSREALLNWYRLYPPDAQVLDLHRVDYVVVSYALRWRANAIRERSAVLGTAWEWRPTGQNAQGYYAGYFRRRPLGF